MKMLLTTDKLANDIFRFVVHRAKTSAAATAAVFEVVDELVSMGEDQWDKLKQEAS